MIFRKTDPLEIPENVEHLSMDNVGEDIEEGGIDVRSFSHHKSTLEADRLASTLPKIREVLEESFWGRNPTPSEKERREVMWENL